MKEGPLVLEVTHPDKSGWFPVVARHNGIVISATLLIGHEEGSLVLKDKEFKMRDIGGKFNLDNLEDYMFMGRYCNHNREGLYIERLKLRKTK